MAIGTGSNTRALALGVVAALGLALFVVLLAPRPAPHPNDIAIEAGVSLTEVPTADTDTAQPAATTANKTDQTAAPIVPRFDDFRHEQDGINVVSGKAAPGQVVDILVNGIAVERATANARGDFSALVMLEPSDQPRTLRLLADPDGDAVRSEEMVMVAPDVVVPVETPQPEEPIIAVTSEPVVTDVVAPEVLDDPTTDVAEQPDPLLDAAPDAPEITVAQTPPQIDEMVVAPATVSGPVLLSDADGVRVIQPANGAVPPEVTATVALDTITYDPAGEVLLAGRARGEGFVRVYLDNQPVTSSRIDAQGDWRIDLPQVDTGIYTLRIDEVDDAGDVISRIETPFKREEPDAVAAVMAEETATPGFEVAVKTVQPGATLWAIAKERFGEGIMYVAVFEANRDLIRDPDLIYPGQVFRLPEIAQ